MVARPPAAGLAPDERLAWIAWSGVAGVGPATFRRLLERFGSAAEAWRAPAAELERCGVAERALATLVAKRRSGWPGGVIERLAALGAQVLTWLDAAYPERLKQIASPPIVLYVRGDLQPADEWAVAVVGTRRASVYGRDVTARIVGELAASGVTVVSGLARGIDSHAHRAALDAGGRTLAVLGSGIDVLYPPENARLAEAIVGSGALLSELPPGTQPEAHHFPLRNRVISGLVLAVLVVEAPEGSGALITADSALDQGRDVFAVPGNITQRSSAGTNRLIQDGAKLVTCARDVLEELRLGSLPQQLEMRALLPENPVEQRLVALLREQPAHLDELVRASGLPTAEVSSAMAMLELKGFVRALGGQHYALA
ncbi:MAG: DNA-protecting protein DprA [Chloroflexi bacterium]|nr:DNA-protecting protein DprA [Chloroflexota bacterium]